MDNSELHYVSYDPDEIYTEMLDAYIDAGGDVIFGGDEKEMLLRAVQAILVQTFAGVDNGLRMGTLRYAVREYLDMIGETRGCIRKGAVKASMTAVLTETNDGVTGTVSAGQLLTANGERLYELTEDVILTGSGNTHEVLLTCTEAGVDGNGVQSGTHLQFLVAQDGVASAVTTSKSAGGEDEEDDDSYRERIRTYYATLTTTGSAVQYESSAMAASTAVVDAKAVMDGAGVVGVYIIVDSGAEVDDVVQIVYDRLNDADTKPLTDTVTVSEAQAISYTINIEYRGDTGVDISGAVDSAIASYANWQDNTIGQAFNPDRLMALLYQAGCTRVTWGSGSTFDGGQVVYTDIPATKRCKGTITARRLN